MTTARDCFKENITKHLPSARGALTTEQSLAWNLNQGLLMLADQLTSIQHEQQRQSQELQQLRQLLLQTR